MQNHFFRTGGTLLAGGLLTMAIASAVAAQPAHRPETSLLGVTLLKSSFRDVLKKFGRPNEIQAGGPYVPSEGAPVGAQAAGGGMMGGGRQSGPGMPGMGGGSAGGGGSSKVTSKNGFPGQSGSGATAGPGGGSTQMAAPRGPSMPGGTGGTGGLPGFGGSQSTMGPGGDGGMMGQAMPGAPDAGGAAGAASDGNIYESTWWYHDRVSGLHKSFLFNKDGRVIQVQEYGHDIKHRGGKTRLGVGLGSGLNAVLRNYGWSNDAANSGPNMIMRFGAEDKVAFQLVNNMVVGITIAVVKDVAPAETP